MVARLRRTLSERAGLQRCRRVAQRHQFCECRWRHLGPEPRDAAGSGGIKFYEPHQFREWLGNLFRTEWTYKIFAAGKSGKENLPHRSSRAKRFHPKPPLRHILGRTRLYLLRRAGLYELDWDRMISREASAEGEVNHGFLYGAGSLSLECGDASPLWNDATCRLV